MRRLFYIALSAVLLLGVSKCAKGVKPDLAMAAMVGGDYTALIEGCGNQLVPGYTYCRVTEGQVANSNLTFVAPPTQCLGEEPCVTFKVFFPSGEPSLGGAIAQGQTRVAIPWKALVKRDTFKPGDRGFWPFIYRIRWLDLQGKEHLAQSEGEIRLRVMRSLYIPLNEIMEDENFVWSWVEDGVTVKMTTGMRTYVGKRP